MEPVNADARARIFRDLKKAHPEAFAVDQASRVRWHRIQAGEAERAMAWDAAVFHWEEALKGESELQSTKSEDQIPNPVAADVSRLKHPEDQSGLTSAATGLGSHPAIPLESRLAYARQAAAVQGRALLEGHSRWSVILPRQPWVSTGMLDLTRFYHRSLGEAELERKRDAPFRDLASGIHLLGRVGFDVRGIIHLGVTNHVTIPVGRPCQRIHFLHAASETAPGLRQKLGSYQVTYANGETAAVPLLNPQDVPPYSVGEFHQVSPLSWTNALLQLRSALAWSGHNPAEAGTKQTVLLTSTTWDLPAAHRGEVVATLELCAGPAQSAPLVFAITVEPAE